MALCRQFLSVQRCMDCSHLPPGARTRWVTERIASAQALARRSASGIKKTEITGSSRSGGTDFSAGKPAHTKKNGNEGFFAC